MAFGASFFMQPKLYLFVQIDAEGIGCALGQIASGHIKLQSLTYAVCKMHDLREVTANRIVSPFQVAHFIKSFLEEHQIPHKLPVYCFTTLQTTLPHQPLLTLQIALSVSKIAGPLRAIHIGTLLTATTASNSTIPLQTNLPNLLTILSNPSIDSWQYRLRICATVILCPLALSLGYAYLLAANSRQLRQQEKELVAYQNNLKPRVQQVKELEGHNALLQDRIQTVKDLTEENEFPVAICTALASCIPAHTWLTSITIGSKSLQAENLKHVASSLLQEAGDGKIPVIIAGKTTKPDDVGNFLEALSEALPSATLSIEHLGRSHKNSAKPTPATPYNFTIAGTIED